MTKAIHTWCGQIIPNVSIQIESQSEDILLLGNIQVPTSPSIMIIDAPEYCPMCHYKLYKKDIAVMIGGE